MIISGKYISRIILLSFIFLSIAGCEQSDPPEIDDTIFYRDGDKLKFSGYDWTIKIHEDQKVGPGPNYFSGHEDDVFFDANGHLHMKIAKHDGKWFSTEIISDKVVGYGTYIFTIEGDMLNIPENIVLGLFTWDNNTFFTDANSEVDIEFSRWGDVNTNETLKYSVQPLNFGPYYPERTMDIELTEDDLGISTHSFIWTDTLISWKSWEGSEYGSGRLIGEWTFDLNNPARVKNEGGNSSQAVIIPRPGATTNARINFWIAPWIAPAPTDTIDHEVIIRKFKYIPL